MFSPRFAALVALAFSVGRWAPAAPSAGGIVPAAWSGQFTAARRLCQTGNFTDAVGAYQQLIDKLKAQTAPLQLVARAYDELAIALKVIGRLDEAEKNYLRALDTMEGADGHAGERVGVVLSDVGAFYVEVGQFARAERYLLESAEVFAASPTTPIFCRAAVIQDLAALYYREAHYDRAEAKFREALSLLRKAEAEDRPQLAVVLGDLSQTLITEDQVDDAAPLLKESMAIFDSMPGRFQSNYYAVLVIAANLQRKTANMDAAEHTCDRALKMGDEILGPDNPRMISSLDVCSAVYKAQHRRKEGKLLASRSLALKTEIASHSTAAKTVDVAVLLQQNNR